MYLISYFTTDAEALHLATSQDGEHFEPVGGGEPVLFGEVGTRTLRDPFVGVAPDGRYHLLATDGWSSPHIVHATSTDLRRWSPQRLLSPMADVPGALNAWAPEMFVDDGGACHLIWSSVVDPRPDDQRDWHHAAQEQRIWHVRTEDFETFDEPDLFFDPGHSVIDATVLRDDGRFVMAYKDERGDNEPTTPHKNILLTTFTEPGGRFAPPIGPVTPPLVEGPSLFRRGDELVLIFDHYAEGGYGALATRDLTSWEPATISLPEGMRHASVVALP